MIEKQLVSLYMVVGMMYIAIKIIFVSSGHLHPNGIELEAIPAISTYVVGIWVLMTTDSRSQKPFQFRLMAALPMVLLIFTPLFTYRNQGEVWLAEGRLSILILYECLALMQLTIAVALKRTCPR